MKIYRMNYRMRIFKCPKCKVELEFPSVRNHSIEGVVCKTDKTPLSEMKVTSDKVYKVVKEVENYSGVELTADAFEV